MKSELTITPEDGPAAGQRIVHLEGPVVLETLFKFRDALAQETAASVILDFTRVPYIYSAGLGSLLRAAVRCQSERRALVLAGLNAKCRALLEMTRVESTFKMFPTVEEAPRGPL